MFLYFTLLLDLGTVLSTIALVLQEKYYQAFSGVMSFHYILTSQFPLREISCSHSYQSCIYSKIFCSYLLLQYLVFTLKSNLRHTWSLLPSGGKYNKLVTMSSSLVNTMPKIEGACMVRSEVSWFDDMLV